MDDCWASYVKLGLELWETTNLPLIKKGDYGTAEKPLDYMKRYLQSGLERMPKNTVRYYIELILFALNDIKDYFDTPRSEADISEDLGREDSFLSETLSRIGDLSIIAGFGADAVLKAEQNDEQYQQGL